MGIPETLRAQRLGLLVIGSSLVAIAVACVLVLSHLERERTERLRAAGLSLVQLVSSFPYEHLVASVEGPGGPLAVLRGARGSLDLAYAAVVDSRGSVVSQVATDGGAIPAAAVGGPADWMGERRLALADGRRVREFRAPLIQSGRLAGQLRLAFFEPIALWAPGSTSFLATLALVIFLLAPVFYLLSRREIRPVSDVSTQMRSLADGDQVDLLCLDVPGELGEFVSSFNRFVERTQKRLSEVEHDATGSLVSARVVSYEKTRLETALETLPDGAILLDEYGVAVLSTEKAASLLGLHVDDIRGRRAAEWGTSEDLVDFVGRFAGGGARMLRAARVELAPRDDGRRIGVQAHPLVTARGRSDAPGTLITLRDLASERIDRQRQSDFVSHVAHELKSPLNVLMMYSETLASEEGESEEFRIEACNVIRDEVERLSGLIKTLLTIARIESGTVALDRQRVMIRDYLQDALELAARPAGGLALDLQLDVDRDLPPIYVDKDLLRVALSNLLTNAVKYNQPGGSVRLIGHDAGEAIEIRVEDTGLGISEIDQPRIFEKFFRSDDKDASQRGGHGLGLTLARQIVELHAGRIGVESVPGEGAHFSILLPKTPALLQETK